MKGLVHPPAHTIAFPRYIPDSEGDRIRGELRYKKIYLLEDRYEYVRLRYPQFFIFDPVFNEILCEVDDKSIIKYYEPQRRLRELREVEEMTKIQAQTLQFIELLKSKSNMSWENFGVSGSILVDLCTPTSDTDVMVYGSKASHLVSGVIRELQVDKGSGVASYTRLDLRRLYERRVQDTPMPFDIFVWHEARKSFQGRFQGREFFIRFIKDWGEALERYGDVIYKPLGYAKVKLRVIDDEDAIFTPCTYRVKQLEVLTGGVGLNIEEVSSYRGRFCEQAKVGEEVEVQGKVEVVIMKKGEYQRILVGGKPTDYMFKVRSA